MTKNELVAAVAARLDMPKTTAEAAVAAVIDTIQTAVAAGETVRIPGFLTVERTFRAGGERRNPATGETVVVADKHVPTVKVGKTFKDAVNA